MTTLPMHPDGKGIDWARIYIKDNCLMRDNLFWSLEGFAAAVSARARERCAKRHEEQIQKIRRGGPGYSETVLAKLDVHEESAAAFREMEP